MRSFLRTALAALLVVSLTQVAACTPSGPVKVGESANGTTVHMAVGQTLTIALPGNITTGYDWVLAGAPPSGFTTMSLSYTPTPTAGVAGAGGVRTYVYKADTAGTVTIKLNYARSFEKGVAPAKVFTVTVVVG